MYKKISLGVQTTSMERHSELTPIIDTHGLIVVVIETSSHQIKALPGLDQGLLQLLILHF